MSIEKNDVRLVGSYLLVFTESRNFKRDSLIVHADCYKIDGVQLSELAQRKSVDREISRHVLADAEYPVKIDEYGRMACDLVRESAPDTSRSQQCVLVRKEEYDWLKRSLKDRTAWARKWKLVAHRQHRKLRRKVWFAATWKAVATRLYRRSSR